MEPYKAMYLKMFNVVTDAERQLSEIAELAERLRTAQQECEEMFLEDAADPPDKK